MPLPVPFVDGMRRPVVTITVRPSDALPITHELTCYIDTGRKSALVFQSYEKARQLGLAMSNRSAFFSSGVEGLVRHADGTTVQYLIDFLRITEWVDGRPRWVTVFIAPPPNSAANPVAWDGQSKQGYREPDALMGLDLLESARFRLTLAEQIVELLPLR
jgi:hypothetical protein